MFLGIFVFLSIFFLLTYHRFTLGLFFFFLLLPTYLIRFHIGPFPTTLLEGMFGAITLVWLIHIYQGNISIKDAIKKITRHRSLIIATSLFVIGATASIITAADTRAALGLWKAFYIEPIIFSLILITTLKEKKDVQLVLLGLLLCGVTTSMLAIYQHFTGWMVPHSFWANRNTYRVTGWYGFPNAVGLFLGPLVPLALATITESLKQFRASKQTFAAHYTPLVIAFLFLVLSPLAIWYAKSTGAIIGIIAGIGVLLLLNKKTTLPTLVLGILALVGLFALPPNNPIYQEIFMQDRSGQLRLDMWAETAEYLREHPITGAGLASYHTVIQPYRIDKWIEVFHHPHNIFLTMWVNIGLVGLIGFVWIAVWFVRVALSSLVHKSTDKKSQHNLVPYLLSAMVVVLVMGLVDSPYIKNDLAFMFWTLPALLLIATRNSTRA